jgi:hypothetical protein
MAQFGVGGKGEVGEAVIQTDVGLRQVIWRKTVLAANCLSLLKMCLFFL